MIYKYISSKQIVSKILSDLDIREEDVRISSILEWIGEAVEKIGSVTQLDRKISGVDGEPIIPIIGNQAQLPSSLHRLNQVTYSPNLNGPWIPMNVSASSFNVWKSTDRVSGETSDPIPSQELIINTVRSLYNVGAEEALKLINENVNIRPMIVSLLSIAGQGVTVPNGGIKYSIKPGYIVTNIPTGYLRISYDSVKVDSNGYMLIPDLMSYIEAVYWYVVMKLKYPEYMSGRMNREIYYDMRRSWNFYCKQAYAESIMPNEDGMEAIKNVWVKLIPNMNAHSSTFEDITLYEGYKDQSR